MSEPFNPYSILTAHRSIICCPEDCWCWGYEQLLINTERLRTEIDHLTKENKELKELVEYYKKEAIRASNRAGALEDAIILAIKTASEKEGG